MSKTKSDRKVKFTRKELSSMFTDEARRIVKDEQDVSALAADALKDFIARHGREILIRNE